LKFLIALINPSHILLLHMTSKPSRKSSFTSDLTLKSYDILPVVPWVSSGRFPDHKDQIIQLAADPKQVVIVVEILDALSVLFMDRELNTILRDVHVDSENIVNAINALRDN
jgi:hypothetical protein